VISVQRPSRSLSIVPQARGAPPTPPSPHALTATACLEALGSSESGLDRAEAARRLLLYGPNRLPDTAVRGPFSRFLNQFDSVMIRILLGAALITALMQSWIDTGVILAVVIANAVIGFIHEGRAEAAMADIRRLLAPRSAVLRDGRRIAIAAAEIVAGDVVVLEAGDRVPADLRLLEARQLAVDESMLTGESVPAIKDPAPVAADAPLGDRAPMLWSGTMIVRGTARGVVVATGLATELGRIGGLVERTTRLRTPLVSQMDGMAQRLSLIIVIGAALLLVWGHVVGGRDGRELFMAVVGLAVAAIPEGLPAVMTITLALGVQAMARRNAIVRRLPAIEAIGAVSVICTDKTGTLTRSEMVVTAAETPAGSFGIGGVGYAPEGAITPAGDLAEIGRAAALCNDAVLRPEGAGWAVEGDPMEGALLAFAGKVGAMPEARRLDAIPFDSQHRFMAVLTEDTRGRQIHVKGAPERVLAMCRGIDRHHWHARADALAQRGLRVLAFAGCTTADGRIDAHEIAHGLDLIGIVGLIDPPRPEAVAAVAECLRAGIAVKMITGDHAGTAAAIAREIGLRNPARVLTGAEMDRLDDAALALEVASVDVFARTSPEHKLRLVHALQSCGSSVAMTGDGVNDAPALRRADAGIAMGCKGTEAAKQAADLVLADDNFVTIAAAVREGRRVHDNLRKVIGFELPTNAGEAIVVVLALIFGLHLPITPVQILWVNLITGITLGLALAFEPAEPGIMDRPPRRRDAPILPGALIWHVILVAALFAVIVFAVFGLAVGRGHSIALAQTMAMNTLVVLEIFHLCFIRTINGRSRGWGAPLGTPVIRSVIVLVAGAQLALTYLPWLQPILGTEPIPLVEGLVILSAGVAFVIMLDLERRLRGGG